MKHTLSVNQQKTLALFDSQGQISTNDVVEKLAIPRPTVKQILNRLKELDLIEQKGLGRASYYTLRQESEILDPQGKQLITVYKGMESFRGLFDRLTRNLSQGDFYWSFAFKNEHNDPTISNLLINFHAEINRKGVDDRTIASKDVEGLMRRNFKAVPNFKLRFTRLEIPVGIIILKDCIINLVWGEHPLAIVIKTPEIYKRYHSFFLSAWEQADDISNDRLVKAGNTPLVALHNNFGVKNLWMKDESKNPTGTFKDRLAYEMVRPLYEQHKNNEKITKATFSSISYGNTAKAMGFYSKQLNNIVGQEVSRAVVFVPPALEQKKFGPDTHNTIVPAKKILDEIERTCQILPIDLSKQIYRAKDLENLAKENKAVLGEFIDITEGLNRPAYVQIIIEAIEQQLKESPDYVIVPFGAGILCNEIIDYINDHKLHTKVIPVSSGDPKTIAIMLYGPIWVDTKSLLAKGWGWTRHEETDRKGRLRAPYKVFHVSDNELKKAMKTLTENSVDAEPSAASGFAILPRLQKIDPSFNPKKHSVLVINTGDSLVQYK
ncbi:MAG: pyridoxal-phosphate dependent enzyme [Candidatus Falkowbacteria bacterium]|nr:pyridoxal-phosphate dependent enzyme [Candidatus Falkowbacteria bacterium]